MSENREKEKRSRYLIRLPNLITQEANKQHSRASEYWDDWIKHETQVHFSFARTRNHIFL